MSSALRFGFILAFSVSALLVGWILRQSSAQTSVTTELSTEEDTSVVAASGIVAVEGRIVSTTSRWVDESQMILTDVTLAIRQSSDPNITGSITFTAPGGELPEKNLRVTINAIPIFRENQTIAVSLDSPATGTSNHYRYRTHLHRGGLGT